MSRRPLGAVIGLSLMSFATQAAESPWYFRFGVITVGPHEESTEVSTVPNSGVGVNSDTIGTLTVNYSLNYHWKLETFLATGFNHSLYGTKSIAALGETATLGYDAPTLFIQYWLDEVGFNLRPYIGLGFSYAKFRDEEATDVLNTAFGGETKVSADAIWGGGPQLGFDWRFHDSFSINASITWLDFEPTTATLTTGGVERTVDLDMDPGVYMINIGYHF